MTSFWKSFFVFILVLGACVPTSIAFAGTCVCTTNANDCQAVFLSVSNQTTDACTQECKKILGSKFASSNFADGTGGEILNQQCVQTHAAFLKNLEAAAAPTTKSEKAPSTVITPSLNVEIPGLKFSPAIATAEMFESNFIADYINGVYAFLIGAATIISIVMIMVGGLQYTIGAASSSQVAKGKERIKNAVTGLVLLMCVFLVLQTTNPQLVLQKMIRLQNIEEIPLPAIVHEEVVSAESGTEARGPGVPGSPPYSGAKQLQYPIPKNLPALSGDTYINPPPRKCEKPSVQGVPASYPGVSIDTRLFGNLDCNVSGKTMTAKRPPSSIKMVILHEGFPGNNVESMIKMWSNNYMYGKVQNCKLNKSGKWSHDWCTEEGSFLIPPTEHATPIASHYTLLPSGTFYALTDEGFIVNHCCKQNNISIGIDLQYGGTSPKDVWTEAQYQSLAKLIKALSSKYGFPINDETVRGHCELGSHTDPPHFDLKHLGDILGVSFDLTKHSKKSKTGAEQCNWVPI